MFAVYCGSVNVLDSKGNCSGVIQGLKILCFLSYGSSAQNEVLLTLTYIVTGQ